MATNASYNIASALNHPELTVKSPIMRPAATLNGVLSILGVLIAASRNPSKANSKIKNCQTSGTLTVSFNLIKSNFAGIHSGLLISNKNNGVRNTEIIFIT